MGVCQASGTARRERPAQRRAPGGPGRAQAALVPDIANHRAHDARNIASDLKGECTMFIVCYPKNREMTIDEMIVASELSRL